MKMQPCSKGSLAFQVLRWIFMCGSLQLLLSSPPHLAQAWHIIGAQKMFVKWTIESCEVVGCRGWWKIPWRSLPQRPSATCRTTYERDLHLCLIHSVRPELLILTQLCAPFLPWWRPPPTEDALDLILRLSSLTWPFVALLCWAALALQPPRV